MNPNFSINQNRLKNKLKFHSPKNTLVPIWKSYQSSFTVDLEEKSFRESRYCSVSKSSGEIMMRSRYWKWIGKPSDGEFPVIFFIFDGDGFSSNFRSAPDHLLQSIQCRKSPEVSRTGCHWIRRSIEKWRLRSLNSPGTIWMSSRRLLGTSAFF